MFRTPRRRGFTLVELLVVIAIIGILIALLLPAVQAAREAGRRTQCSNNLHQIGIALHNYHDTKNQFPPGGITNGPCCGTRSGGTWTIFILPFMENSPLHERYQHLPAKNEDGVNRYVREQFIPGFICPSDINTAKLDRPESGPGNGLNYAPGSYRAVSGKTDGRGWFDNEQGFALPLDWKGVLHSISSRRIGGRTLVQEVMGGIVDGTSNTIMVGEFHTKTRNRRRTFWAYTYTSYNQSSITIGQPRALLPDYDRCVSIGGAGGSNTCKRGFGSLHPSVIQFLYADASVHSISNRVDINLLANMATIAGGESTNVDF